MMQTYLNTPNDRLPPQRGRAPVVTHPQGDLAMTTFVVWKYDDPTMAEHATSVLKEAAAEGIVKIEDHAVITWEPGAAKPTLHHSHDSQWSGTGLGAFWGLLVGALFFVPVLGIAAGAAIGALAKATEAVGISKAQLEQIRSEVTPGTSALFAVTDSADLDRLGERFHGLGGHLVTTNLTAAEKSTLLETFGE